MNTDFKVSVGSVPMARALECADSLETCIGEVANGVRKAGKLPLEEMCVLIQHARNSEDLLNVAKKALALIRKGTPGWGVAKDILNAAIHRAETQRSSSGARSDDQETGKEST